MSPIVLIVYVVAVTLVLSLLFPRLRQADAATRRRLWLFTVAGCVVFLLVLFFLAGTARGQETPTAADRCERASPGHIVVYGEVTEPMEVPLVALDTFPRVAVRAALHDGEPATFEGVRIRELLLRAGMPRQLAAGDLSFFVVAEAADGYRALYSIAELEPDFNPDAPILADRADGAPLDPAYGPVQVIVPGELRHVRWVRQVECLRVGTAR